MMAIQTDPGTTDVVSIKALGARKPLRPLTQIGLIFFLVHPGLLKTPGKYDNCDDRHYGIRLNHREKSRLVFSSQPLGREIFFDGDIHSKLVMLPERDETKATASNY